MADETIEDVIHDIEVFKEKQVETVIINYKKKNI